MDKKKIVLLIYILLGSMNLFSQGKIKQSVSGYCDCWERDEGGYLRMEKFDIYWDESDLPNGSLDDGTYKWLWNTLIKEYYCGCNFSSTTKSILLKDSYWRNGKKHGKWKEYFKDNTFKPYTKRAKFQNKSPTGIQMSLF